MYVIHHLSEHPYVLQMFQSWQMKHFDTTFAYELPENNKSQVRLFADDTVVYLTVSSAQDSQVLHSDLDTLDC